MLEASLQKFKDDVCHSSTPSSPQGDTLKRTDQPLIAEQAIRPVGTLHLTLGVMNLGRPDKLEQAIRLLQATDFDRLLRQTNVDVNVQFQAEYGVLRGVPSTLTKSISPPPTTRHDQQPITVSFRSLKSFNAANKTSVLYTAPKDPSNRLLPLCEALRQHFVENGYLVSDTRPLTLHTTIVNTIYVKERRKPAAISMSDRGAEESLRAMTAAAQPRPSTRFDATSILNSYKDYIWAENVVLDRVAICAMGSKKVRNADGDVVGEYYTELASIPLPGVAASKIERHT